MTQLSLVCAATCALTPAPLPQAGEGRFERQMHCMHLTVD